MVSPENKESKNTVAYPETELKKSHAIQASLLKRIFAFLIDMIILNIFVLAPFNNLIAEMMGERSFNNIYQNMALNPDIMTSMTSMTSIVISSSILMLLYFIVLQRKFSQTLGMMIMNLYVMKIPEISHRAYKTGREKISAEKVRKLNRQFRLSFWDALLRNLFLIPFVPFMFLWLADPLFLFFNKNSQRLTEFASRTMVIEMITYHDNTMNRQRWI
ncbi:MAG: RDD family protein [Candidatus Woesearchaeota archaeon]